MGRYRLLFLSPVMQGMYQDLRRIGFSKRQAVDMVRRVFHFEEVTL